MIPLVFLRRREGRPAAGMLTAFDEAVTNALKLNPVPSMVFGLGMLEESEQDAFVAIALRSAAPHVAWVDFEQEDGSHYHAGFLAWDTGLLKSAIEVIADLEHQEVVGTRPWDGPSPSLH